MTTTTTRDRRRFRLPEVRWQGWGLIVLGIFVGLSSIYFHAQDVNQRQCFANYVTKSADIQTKRSALGEQDSDANKAESAATRQLIIDAFASKTRQQAFAAFRKAQVGWAAVDKERARIARQRAANPIPDFPAGTCN